VGKRKMIVKKTPKKNAIKIQNIKGAIKFNSNMPGIK